MEDVVWSLKFWQPVLFLLHGCGFAFCLSHFQLIEYIFFVHMYDSRLMVDTVRKVAMRTQNFQDSQDWIQSTI